MAADDEVLRDDLGVFLTSHRRVILRKVALRREADSGDSSYPNHGSFATAPARVLTVNGIG